MSEKAVRFQPGLILHDAILGAMRASGRSFESWCQERGMAPGAGRGVTHGTQRGPKARELLAQMIADAGPDVVEVGYLTRLRAHVATFDEVA